MTRLPYYLTKAILVISMLKTRLIVFVGSKSDLLFAERIGNFLTEEGFSLKCEYNVASAHRTPDYLIRKIQEYERSSDHLVYITIAGLSDALSGVVAGSTRHPVIACPPDSEKFGWPKVFSSVMTPTGVPILFCSKPENAALAAVRILALADPSIYEEIEKYMHAKKEEVIKANEDIER